MRKLTLTFDNGPDPTCTPFVLDALRDRGIKASFFVCGLGNRLHPACKAKADDGQRILERAQAEGHWIGNHSLTHTIELGTTRDPEVVRREIGDNEELLGPLNERRLFRPYMSGGLWSRRIFSPEAVEYLCAERYTVLLFNCLPRDWENPDGWPEEAFRLAEGQDWSVVVLHDVGAYGSMKRLGSFLDRALAEHVDIVQELPADPACVPISRGEVVGSLDGMVCGDSPEAPHRLAALAVEHVNDA